MSTKKPSKLVTEEYLDEKLEPYVTKVYLDKKFNKKTEEIIEVVNEISARQTEILLQIQSDISDFKEEVRTHVVRLDDCDVRIEHLEKAAN